jgi:SAM-dependent methyltransferase
VFLSPQPTQTESAQFYSTDYMSKAGTTSLFSAMVEIWDNAAARRFAGRIGLHSRVLDYGCGDGTFVRRLHSAGCENAFGFEPMERGHTDPHIFTSIEAIRDAGLSFDAIWMNNSIEHLVDTDATMSQLRGMLKPGGIVWGLTPNASHRAASMFGRNWGYLHFPYHTAMFSAVGLRIAARRWGFSGMLFRKTFLPSAWAFTLEHYMKMMLRTPVRGHLRVYPLLLLATLPVAVVDRLVPGNTTELEFVLTAP